MKPLVKKMLPKYRPDEIDWMGYPITPDNPITYHHIIKKSRGGKTCITNGAILTELAQIQLHQVIEENYPEIYEELAELFQRLNESEEPPTEEYWHNLREILAKMDTLPIEEYWYGLRQILPETDAEQIKDIKIYRRII